MGVRSLAAQGGLTKYYLSGIGEDCLLYQHLCLRYTCTSKRTGLKKMKVVTFSEARNKLKDILDQVVNDADYTIITRRDADDAVVMSLEYFNSLLETVYLLKSPANAAHLERSITQYKQGQVIEQNLLDD
jgi:antitoxin YefM